MRSTKLGLAVAVLLATAIAAPAFAADSMMSGGMKGGAMMAGGMKPSTMMMKPGETIVIMPNGDTMMMPSMKADDGMMKMAMPMDKCMIFMMGADHKMHMVPDMKMADGKMACDDAMMMMKK